MGDTPLVGCCNTGVHVATHSGARLSENACQPVFSTDWRPGMPPCLSRGGPEARHSCTWNLSLAVAIATFPARGRGTRTEPPCTLGLCADETRQPVRCGLSVTSSGPGEQRCSMNSIEVILKKVSKRKKPMRDAIRILHGPDGWKRRANPPNILPGVRHGSWRLH